MQEYVIFIKFEQAFEYTPDSMNYLYLCAFHGGHSKIGITTRPLGCRLAEYFTSDHTAKYYAAVRFDGIRIDQLYAIEKKCLIATMEYFFSRAHRDSYPNSEARYHKSPSEFWEMVSSCFPTPYVIVNADEMSETSGDQVDKVTQPPRHFHSARDFDLAVTQDKMFDYQRECVAAALAQFAAGINKVIINWACGLGKTFTALNIATHESSRILIGAPSRILLSQWFDSIKNIEFLASRIIIVVGHTGMVKNNSNRVHKLKRPNDIREKCDLYADAIVLTTYSSAHKVALAAGEDEMFGTAIFDECHHLCGDRTNSRAEVGMYTDMLKIRARRQISLSATLKGSAYDLSGNFDREIFGEVIDTKSTLWAIEHNRLTDYKLATINMSQKDLDIAIKLCKADYCHRELFLAGYSAVERIKNDPTLTHMLVYANSIYSAKVIKAYIDKIVSHLLPDNEFYNEALSSNDSHNIDRETARFSSSARGIISCVFIFGEGFDMPKLNGVLVAEEMMSEIRIVQSVLRPHRRDPENPGKIAQIILPWIDDEKHSSFSKLRTVVAQLGSEDANLSQRLCVGVLSVKNSVSGGYIEPIVNFRSLSALKHMKFLLWPRGVTKDYYIYEYEVVQEINRELGLRSLSEYYDRRAGHKHWIADPKKYFNERCAAWKNVYDFLGIDVSKFPKHKEEWRLKCLELGITSSDYDKKCTAHNMPRWPDELYANFGNLRSELGEDKPRRRK